METLQDIFHDFRTVKRIISAAKQKTRKRTYSDCSSVSPAKRVKSGADDEQPTPAAIEHSLTLPSVEVDEEELKKVVMHTNRAPLILAFAVTMLKYTMPNQPLSSRLSLAQALVSANSRTKARSIGLEKGTTAEEDGWGFGQPKMKVMGREVIVMKRWGYDPSERTISLDAPKLESKETVKTELVENPAEDSQSNLLDDAHTQPKTQESIEVQTEPALWGLDLEAMRSSNGSSNSRVHEQAPLGLPIHTAESARSYLLKSFATVQTQEDDKTTPKKKSGAVIDAEKERNLALLLAALDLLYKSWAPVVTKEELDRRSWTWYVHVRPDVASGVAGWGGKGQVKISDILQFKRKG